MYAFAWINICLIVGYYGLAQMCAMLHLFPEAATNALLATDQKSIDDLSDREIAYFYCEGYRYAPSSASLDAIQTLSFFSTVRTWRCLPRSRSA